MVKTFDELTEEEMEVLVKSSEFLLVKTDKLGKINIMATDSNEFAWPISSILDLIVNNDSDYIGIIVDEKTGTVKIGNVLKWLRGRTDLRNSGSDVLTVVAQGNSLSVNVTKICRKMGIDRGEEVEVTIARIKKEKNEDPDEKNQ